MFKQGDFIMYSNYGACSIDEIKEKITDKVNRTYYVMHPINQKDSKIITPIDNKKVKMRAIMAPKDAEKIFSAISFSNVIRITDKKEREQVYAKILKEGNPSEIVEIINTLLIEEKEKIEEGKRLSAIDGKYLEKAELLLYTELSVALNMSIEQIKERVELNLLQ